MQQLAGMSIRLPRLNLSWYPGVMKYAWIICIYFDISTLARDWKANRNQRIGINVTSYVCDRRIPFLTLSSRFPICMYQE